MPRNKKFEGDMTQIGKVRTPPFAKLPDIHRLFDERAGRFEKLAPTSPVKDYIDFLILFSRAQHKTALDFVSQDFSAAINPKASDFAMPPLDRPALIEMPLFNDVTQTFFKVLKAQKLSSELQLVLDDLLDDKESWTAIAKNIINQQLPQEKMAHHIMMTGAMQVLYAHAAKGLDAKKLKPLDHNLCPACGGTHTASIVVGWEESEGTRFCSCLYCGTLWHYVRVKCTFCEATGGIEYQEIDGGPGTILAETCKNCLKYCKIVDHQKDAGFEVFADDIGSIALDLLMQQNERFKRGAFNPFMAGY